MTARTSGARGALSSAVREAERLAELVVAAPGGPKHQVFAPFTGELIGEIPLSTEHDVDIAFASARAAQSVWASTSIRHRASVLRRIADMVFKHREELMDLVQLETGKSRHDALEEVVDVLLTATHYANRGPRMLRPKRRRGVYPVLTQTYELHHPVGVVGVIAPWNYPLTLSISDALPALLAGNSVVLKPDYQTTLIALRCLELMHAAGLPEGVFRIVAGDGPTVGSMVVDRADFVMFTGSSATGRLVAGRCGERLIGCSMELGGKNAMLVRADADVARAAEIAQRACFSNSGQLCISMERMYVHRDVADEFIPAFLERVRSMRLRPGVGWGSDMGSLISQRQLDTVVSHVDQAVEAGARVLAGGRARPDLGPFFYEPTVLTDVDESMVLCRTETFGPVVSIYVVDSDAEMIEKANDTVYGLNASVLTRDIGRGREIASQLRAGTVNVNEGFGSAWASTGAPMGGMGQSGVGRRHGMQGLMKYTEPQTIAVQRVIGFGAPGGMEDERWMNLLLKGVRLMTKARIN